MSQHAGLEHCAGCGQAFGERLAFQFQTSSGIILKCLACAVRHGPMLRRSGFIALVVGTILAAINQGDVVLAGNWPSALFWKLPLTYLVPFVVATLGALGTGRLPNRR